jgi:hypothetical protein
VALFSTMRDTVCPHRPPPLPIRVPGLALNPIMLPLLKRTRTPTVGPAGATRPKITVVPLAAECWNPARAAVVLAKALAAGGPEPGRQED